MGETFMANSKSKQNINCIASTVQNKFSRETTVSIEIHSDAEIIWAILMNASEYPRWNSTIISLQGTISKGSKIILKSTLDPSREFKLKVTSLASNKKMIWQSGQAPFFKGVRSFILAMNQDNSVTFQMTERLNGLMFPLASKHIPDFEESFENFARDLKQESEIIHNSKG